MQWPNPLFKILIFSNGAVAGEVVGAPVNGTGVGGPVAHMSSIGQSAYLNNPTQHSLAKSKKNIVGCASHVSG